MVVPQKLLAALPGIARDGAGVLGALLVAYGAWCIYPPAGFIVAGGFLMVGSYLYARGE